MSSASVLADTSPINNVSRLLRLNSIEEASALPRRWRPPERGRAFPKSDALESLFEDDGVSGSP